MRFKILHFLTSLEVGGAQKVRFELVKTLMSQTPELKHFLAYFKGGPMLKEFKTLGVETVQITGRFWKYDLYAYFTLKNFISKYQINFIHSALWASNFFSKTCAFDIGISVILDLHCKKGLLGKKALIDSVVPIDTNIVTHVAVCRSVAQSYDLPNTKIITNGVDLERFAFNAHSRTTIREALGIDPNAVIIGGVGRLEKEKNFNQLIKSFKVFCAKNTVPQPFLLIIGDGSEKKALQTLVKQLELQDNCKILPTKNNIQDFYSAMDCLVLCSQSEGLPMVVIEALANGLAVMLPETLRQEELPQCIYFQEDKLVPELTELLQKDLGDRNPLIDSSFSTQNMVDKYKDLYQEVLRIQLTKY